MIETAEYILPRQLDKPSASLLMEKLMEKGVISGGMIPKIECCIDAISYGVRKVIILDGRVPHAILMEVLTNEGAGTMVVKNKNDK